MDMQKLVTSYLESKKDSWSESTLRSERFRMKVLTAEHLANPQALYDQLLSEERKPYSIKTTFVRAGELAEFAIEQGLLSGPNKVKEFIEKQARLFKRAYVPKTVDMTFEQAVELIEKLPNEHDRAKATELLFTGMRFSESLTLTEDGRVETKGGGFREVSLAKDMVHKPFTRCHSTFYKNLKKVGLTPHMLRKLCATKLASLGATEADLMKIFGWRNSQMASIYVQAQREAEFRDKLNMLRKKG